VGSIAFHAARVEKGEAMIDTVKCGDKLTEVRSNKQASQKAKDRFYKDAAMISKEERTVTF
jgi:hypothetical protein